MEEPIRIGGYRTATQLQVEVAVRTASSLQTLLRPYLLRRRKIGDLATAVLTLPKKTEQVLFCRLSEVQRKEYIKVLNSSDVSAALSGKGLVFRAILTLRGICNHPNLGLTAVNSAIKAKKGYKEEMFEEEDIEDRSDIDWEQSGKLLILSKILPIWKKEGHKVLLFSQSRAMLTLLERLVVTLQLRYLRMDGCTATGRRAGLVSAFNRDDSIFAMLLTTKTGGVGISLTAADRVVLVDPDWNPQTDVQARERAWRLGQTREVTIYRLITRGTIEEKIYQRQIFKMLLSSRILDNPRQKQMFSKSDLRELFSLTEDEGVDQALPEGGAVRVSEGQQELTKTKNTFWRREDPTTRDSTNDIDSPLLHQLEQNASVTSSNTTILSSDHKSEDKEKRLLKALWDGDAISGVYDHAAADPSHPNSLITNTLTTYANERAEEAMGQLQASVLPIQRTNRFGAIRRTGRNDSVSSSSVIRSIRRGNDQINTTSTHNITTPEASMLPRLQQMFTSNDVRLTSQQVIERFGPLDTKFSELFRESLRRIAKLENGYWSKRNNDIS